jgi:PTS system nitrogen regulatory IIA component
MVTLCFLEQAVDFGALDAKPVKALFALVCPTLRAHLQILARLAFALSSAAFRRRVLEEGSRAEILTAVARVDAMLASPARIGAAMEKRVAAGS